MRTAVEQILSKHEAAQGLERIAREMVAACGGAEQLALVGIRRGGPEIAEFLARAVEKQTGVVVPIGAVDITLYRDDNARALPNPRIGTTEVPFDVREKTIVLVDDVLFTARTVRAAMHALLDYGRAKAIKLAVLVDRGGRELPIQADFVIKHCRVEPPLRVEVIVEPDGFSAVIVPELTPDQP